MSTRLCAAAALLAGGLLAAPALAQSPTMGELWPSDDGRSWTYAQHWEDLEHPEPVVIDTRIRIFFDGATVAPTDIQAQYLRQELLGGSAIATTQEPAIADPFLRQVWMARPDLRARVLQVAQAQTASSSLADAPCPQSSPAGKYSVLLNGEFAYRKTTDEIAAWRCNLADTRSWLWLVSDLTPGNTFTLQLVPDITSTVFLHGRIAAVEPATVPAGTFPNCVRVDYVVDYGFSECVDIGGNVTGTFRSETRGHIHYAPGVGPVDCFEEFILHVELTGECSDNLPIGEPATRTTVQLESQPTPVLRSTWGRLKLLYR